MTKFLFLLVLLSSTFVNAQENGHKTPGDTLRLYIDKLPEYEGGMFSLARYLSQELVYPQVALDNREEGVVRVSFRVNEDSTVSNVTVVDSVSQSLDAEAVRLVSAMPGWIPGEMDGKATKVYVQLPIRFKVPSLKKRRRLKRQQRRRDRANGSS